MSPSLAGLHDIESSAIAPADTWLLDTVALSENPVPKTYPANLNVIARLNWGYGSTGTLPVPDQYQMFAQRVAQYVSASSGCRRWQIGNETNLRREWPDQIPIYPWHYTACYRLCRRAIRQLPGHEHDEVLIAGTGPWNDECKYPDNHHGDWITYFRDVVELLNGELDGFALHSYCHGYDPALVTSTARMDSPFHNRYYNFLTYQDYCHAIPLELAHLPAYLTECNGDGPWQATGLIPAMLTEINAWNLNGNTPAIHCVINYRYTTQDEGARFAMSTKPDVMAEYHNAVAIGYQSPAGEPEPPQPPIEPPWEPGPEPTPEPEREIDPELIERGVTVSEATVSPHWHLIRADFLNEAESGGRHHMYIETLAADGTPVAGVGFLAKGQGSETPGVSNDKLGFDAANVPMWASEGKNGYTVYLDNGDTVVGLGMGDETEGGFNAGIHTCTILTYQFLAPQVEPPNLLPHTEYVCVTAGANLRTAPVNGRVLDTVPFREAVGVDGITDLQSDGETWLHATYGDHVGYIQSPLLSLTQPEPILPPVLLPPPSGLILIWPTITGRVTQWFNSRQIDYSRWGLDSHDGIDIACPTGTAVHAVCHGKVVAVGDDPEGFGLFVRIYHEAHGFHSLYGHLSRQTVHLGEIVTRGKQIGEVGSTGNVFPKGPGGSHLHLSFRVGSEHDYFRVHTGHKQGASDPMCIYAVVNRSDPNLLIP